MSLLEFNNLSPKRSGSRKPFKLVVGICALVGVIALGSTFAANIAINTGAPIEFGQGVAQTTACDSQVFVTPYSTFVNGDPGDFRFTSILVSGVDGTNQSNSSAGCAGKVFKFESYAEDGTLLGSSFSISLDSNGNFFSEDGDLTSGGVGTTESSATLTFQTAPISAIDIYQITIESAKSESSEIYALGDTGPGGGVIIFIAESPQPWGTYLESAPIDYPLGSYGTGRIGPSPFSSELDISSYNGGGLSDWRWPTSQELILMANLSVSNFSNSLSWTWSSPLDNTWYWSSNCDGSGCDYLNPPITDWNRVGISGHVDGGARVRPVRSF
ncbi:MAG: hypothetical protein F2690_04785 [Actinobacteria bacterium]|uniref:Unannotated protein n=1 Tax=freshwater metagenome TaxID=449393 RepID=A0A6J7A0I8_9ZZZZ|nr:hypothetical protein [Actinomycetota bacterium]MSX72172.1 hypothetical protein [Actinomycetota bacterium]MSY69863.1 hypothetical protein [Actinomycetota bacterium]MTA76583.1 hypothetical protein [Actinomycetota bacterium]